MATLGDEACWEYLDPKGFKRGPFASKTMVAWYDAGMLPEELRVRHSVNMAFMPIRELFPSPLQPFRTKPPPRPAPMPVAAPAPQVGPCTASWLYIDTKGAIQGPFLSNQMHLWYQHKMLPEALRLRRTTDRDFATIAEFFPKPLVPFQSQPVMPRAASGQGPLRQDAIAAMMAPTNGNAAFAKQAAPAPAPAPATPQQTPAPAQPAAQQPAAQPKKAAQAQAKAGKGKTGKAGKTAAGPEEAEAEEAAEGKHGKDGKGGKAGKGGPIGAAKPTRANAKQQANAWWSDPQWSGGDKWWEWSSWNGWSGDGEGWEAHDGHARGKNQGAEWKQSGAAGDAAGNGGPIGATPPKESKADKTSAAQQQQNGFGLKWGPKTDATDLFPEMNQKRVLDEGIVWEERWVSPLAVRFSQGKIHPFFHERGPISEVLLQIQSAADDTTQVRRIEPPFPPMRLLHLKPFGVLVTLDNRRLYALQRFALQEWPTICLVKALCVEELTPTRLKAENRKFTNRIGGLQIEIESRSNAFDTFSWVTEAGRLEHPRFCRPIAFKAEDKALSLLPVLVVHALLCPQILPLLRSRWPLLQHLAANLIVPQRREFPARRLMLRHVLEIARPKRDTVTCPQVCVGYQMETLVRLSKGKSCLTSNHTITRPLKLLEAPLLLSPMQRKVLAALLPFFCLPYARSVLRGQTQDWVVAFLLAWGKVSVASSLDVPPL